MTKIFINIILSVVMSSFAINNTKFFTKENYTLIVGSIDVISKPPHSIALKSEISSTSHVILDKNNLYYFRKYMSKSPITNNAIYAYDQIGNIVSRYESIRKNNDTGTINISIESVSLLGNILLPCNIKEGDNIFLPFTSYSGLDSVVSEKYRSELLYKDIEIFRTSNNLLNVTLVIGKTLHSTIKNILSDNYDHFPLLFKSIIITEDSQVINYIVEMLCGKVITGHNTSFQGFLNFGTNYEVIHSTICPIESIDESIDENIKPIKLTNRQGGRIQVNVDGLRGLGNFIIILCKKDNSEEMLYFIEEITNTIINISRTMIIDNSAFPCISINYLENYLDAIKFQKELYSTGNIDRLAYIHENSLAVIQYLFTNPYTDIEDIKNLNCISRTIYNDYLHLINEIRSTLEQNIINSRVFSPSHDLKLGRQLGFKDFFQSPSINPKPYIERAESGINL